MLLLDCVEADGLRVCARLTSRKDDVIILRLPDRLTVAFIAGHTIAPASQKRLNYSTLSIQFHIGRTSKS